MNRFTLGKITPSWLRRQFLKSAINHEDFTYQTWKALFLNAQGKENLYEPLFRFRLMWSEWLKADSLPKVVSPYVKPSLFNKIDLPGDADKALASIAQTCIDKRGLARFKKDGSLPELRSIICFGSSNTPGAKHYTDQMQLYVHQQTKEESLSKAWAYQHAEKIYKPNE